MLLDEGFEWADGALHGFLRGIPDSKLSFENMEGEFVLSVSTKSRGRFVNKTL